MSDISWLDPGRLGDIRKLDKLPESANREFSTLAKVERSQVGRELLQVAVHYDDYITPLQEHESLANPRQTVLVSQSYQRKW